MSAPKHTAVETRDWREIFASPWSTDGSGFIWAQSLRGGVCHVADVRGWGHLTGGGHGALGLSGEEAAKVQDDVSRAMTALPDLLSSLEGLVSIIDKAGLHNLSNGVQLGQVSWAVKANDRLAAARAAIAKATGAET